MYLIFCLQLCLNAILVLKYLPNVACTMPENALHLQHLDLPKHVQIHFDIINPLFLKPTFVFQHHLIFLKHSIVNFEVVFIYLELFIVSQYFTHLRLYYTRMGRVQLPSVISTPSVIITDSSICNQKWLMNPYLYIVFPNCIKFRFVTFNP